MPVASIIAFWLDGWGHIPIEGSDSAAGADTAFLSAQVPGSDTATGSESSSLSVALSASDSALGNDFSVGELEDRAHANDAAEVHAFVTVSDSASGTDALRSLTGNVPGIALHGVYAPSIALRGSYVVVALPGRWDSFIPLRGRYVLAEAFEARSVEDLALVGAL